MKALRVDPYEVVHFFFEILALKIMREIPEYSEVVLRDYLNSIRQDPEQIRQNILGLEQKLSEEHSQILDEVRKGRKEILEVMRRIEIFLVETGWEKVAQSLTRSIAEYNILMEQRLGIEKWNEMSSYLWGEGGKMVFPQVEKVLNIKVENAIGASTLASVVVFLHYGPGLEWEVLEETPQRCVTRITNCPWYDVYKEFGIKPEDMICPSDHIAFVKRGMRAVNPNITHKLTKAMPWGDYYCEDIYEFEE